MISETEQGGSSDPNWTGADPDKPKRNKRRFQTPAEVAGEIDKVTEHRNVLMREAEIMDKFADVLRLFPDFKGTKDVMNIFDMRAAANAKRRYASRRDASLAKLRKTHAAINTAPLLVVRVEGQSDESLPLQ